MFKNYAGCFELSKSHQNLPAYRILSDQDHDSLTLRSNPALQYILSVLDSNPNSVPLDKMENISFAYQIYNLKMSKFWCSCIFMSKLNLCIMNINDFNYQSITYSESEVQSIEDYCYFDGQDQLIAFLHSNNSFTL